MANLKMDFGSISCYCKRSRYYLFFEWEPAPFSTDGVGTPTFSSRFNPFRTTTADDSRCHMKSRPNRTKHSGAELAAIKKAIAAFAAAGCVWLMVGCAEVLVPGTLAGGGEAYRYTTDNVAKKTFVGDVGQVSAAAREALVKMGIELLSISTEDGETTITAATTELDISIEMKPITAHTTKVAVNAVEDYVLKDRATAVEILGQIDRALDHHASNDASSPRVFVRNQCRQPIEVIVYYLAGRNEPASWQTHGWFSLKPGQKKHVANTLNRYVYFYGESLLNHKMTWTGEMLHWFEGKRYPFFKVDMGTAMEDFTQSFICE